MDLKLNGTTLGGVETDMTVMNYRCSIRDRNGNLEFFEAYGMEAITDHLSKIAPSCIRKFFPHLHRGKYGDCLGGTHPDLKESTRKSDSLFSVHHHIVCA